jgi:hypothetical protein
LLRKLKKFKQKISSVFSLKNPKKFFLSKKVKNFKKNFFRVFGVKNQRKILLKKVKEKISLGVQ